MSSPAILGSDSASSRSSPGNPRSGWTLVAESLARPYRVTVSMVVLVSLVPFYIFIGDSMAGKPLHIPAIALDRRIPLQPAWSLVYGTLYLFLIVLPVFVVRDQEQIRRTVRAYLAVWIPAYVCFLLYPTSAPRPEAVSGHGFGAWGLRFLYDADPPFNCFPSLHVAHSFVSAFACRRVNRGVGVIAMVSAALVAVSTLFTKQHYVLDVVAGFAMACAAYALFLRRDADVPELDRRAAPYLALAVVAIIGLMTGIMWVVYKLSGEF